MVYPISTEEREAMRAEMERVTMGDEVRFELRTAGAYNTETYRPSRNVNVLYEGPCAINLSSDPNDPEIIGEGMRTIRQWRIATPARVTNVTEGAIAVIVSARDMWVPREMVVVMVAGGNFAGRRRFVCKELA